ncbi:AraC family transcriptional regulator [Lentzea nigeriaca]|uniref:AraC family transcriptional regulator n=1 Tax=Lentzea nigeriaca TaxID=1128665 RepID=UPI00195CC220|nr:AraC family transcriptional regulator [Lentzea nigeriaca]MBM7856315.1 AraC-like DNA-binding protein [Lentzea nigeriaca]
MTEGASAPVEPLNEALERIRLEGAIFMRCEFTERWALSDLGGPSFAAMMHPGAERLILFHVVASGRCWVSTPDGERTWANAGEVIVLPYGDEFRVGGEDPVEPVSVMTVVPPPPWNEMPTLRHGEGGSRTDIVCGCLYSEDPLFDPDLKAFPPAFVVRAADGPARSWFDASIAYALEQAPGGGGIRRTKLPEMLIIEVLRLYLATAPGADRGWLAAVRDPVLAPAMKAIHGQPGRRWTVEDLARLTAVSRSSLDARFREVLGLSPIRYVNEWRMRVAQDLLATTEMTVAAVARRIEYESEEAFSRAFKQANALSPSAWRARRSAGA